VFCVGPLCGPPLRWWVLYGALLSVLVPCVGLLCVGPLCGSPVGVPRRAAFHVASTRVMPPARSHAPALIQSVPHRADVHIVEPKKGGRVWVNTCGYSYMYVYRYIYMCMCVCVCVCVCVFVYNCVSIGSVGPACCRGPAG